MWVTKENVIETAWIFPYFYVNQTLLCMLYINKVYWNYQKFYVCADVFKYSRHWTVTEHGYKTVAFSLKVLVELKNNRL